MHNDYSAGVDGRSIGLCLATVFLKMLSDVTLSDVATLFAALAAITTVLYNVQRMYKEAKKD